MIVLPALLFILWGEEARCLEENGGFTFDGDLRHFAVATNTVYIATAETLYQLSHDLTLVQSLTQRGILKGGCQMDAQFSRVSETDERNATFSVNMLLPFVETETLISCGVIECGYCEVLDLKNISNVQYMENIQVGSPRRSSASIGFLVNVEETTTETYILTAIQQYEVKSTKSSCSTESEAVQLRNTNHKQYGTIFSEISEFSIDVIKRCPPGNAEFVDGFQISLTIYLFSNLPSSDTSNRVRLIWLEGKTDKAQTLRSLRGATLSISDGGRGSRLLASSVIPGGPPVLWSGVFSVDGGPTDTELLLFDISPPLTGDTDEDPDFCSVCSTDRIRLPPKTLKPKAVLFRQKSMTSVLAVRHKAWMVFFIGTGDGQLIKMKRVPAVKCSTSTNVQDCWSAQDPYCVWCGTKKGQEQHLQRPEISSIAPSVVSFYGRNHAVLSGSNLSDVTRVRIQADMDCTPQESPVWNNTGVKLTFHIPSADNKGVVKVCVLLPDGSCHGNATITYRSSPSCTHIVPSSTWISGKRNITLMGSHLEFVEGVTHSHAPQEVRPPKNRNHQSLTYDTPAAEKEISTSTVFLKVANETLACLPMTYYPEPEFTSFTSTREGDDVHIIIQKKADKLEMTVAELEVWGVEEEKQHPCIMETKATSNETDFFISGVAWDGGAPAGLPAGRACDQVSLLSTQFQAIQSVSTPTVAQGSLDTVSATGLSGGVDPAAPPASHLLVLLPCLTCLRRFPKPDFYPDIPARSRVERRPGCWYIFVRVGRRVADYAIEFRDGGGRERLESDCSYGCFSVWCCPARLKDHLAPLDLPEDLDASIALAIKIDKRLFEREGERGAARLHHGITTGGSFRVGVACPHRLLNLWVHRRRLQGGRSLCSWAEHASLPRRDGGGSRTASASTVDSVAISLAGVQ
ncbi:hypothetical protein PFLUV_G00266450 [Perca fluviatilis]|uniref:Sema domain-containing protein n=1 Tax=Perca fluviatilis TaxID=8168 RepID=A0A6A5E384_PERFL|nr:hypothetical protein PFLUV_G00266450 [Perca fluviatilis]